MQERVAVTNQQDKIAIHQQGQEKAHIHSVKKDSGSSLGPVMAQLERNDSRKHPLGLPIRATAPSLEAVTGTKGLERVMVCLEASNAEFALEQEQKEDMKRRKKDEIQEWDDLDVEDEDDPLMVSEYVADIFEYMQVLEVNAHCIFPSGSFD